MKKYNFIDLFAGCGGLSEGFYSESFEPIVHLEIDKWACKSLETRMKFFGLNPSNKVLNEDITDEKIIKKLDDVVQNQPIDLIIGGPPCQAYSTLGRAKDSNGMNNDPRNFLFESYVKILNHYLPKIFVFENVIGLITAKVNGEKISEKIISELSNHYNLRSNLKECILNSVNYGVPQVRKRIIIIGIRDDLDINIDEVYDSIKKTNNDLENNYPKLLPPVTVKDAISDLPFLKPNQGEKEISFKYTFENEFLRTVGDRSLDVLYDHICRRHNENDQFRYREMARNHWTYKQFLEKHPDFEHSKPRVFSNSYTVQFWEKPSRTIIAHLSKDGNQFIHPDYKQSRTLTVREAARLQSFPDNFIFEGPRTAQYKQIGNAVPPLMSTAIAKGMKTILKKIETNNGTH